MNEMVGKDKHEGRKLCLLICQVPSLVLMLAGLILAVLSLPLPAGFFEHLWTWLHYCATNARGIVGTGA